MCLLQCVVCLRSSVRGICYIGLPVLSLCRDNILIASFFTADNSARNNKNLNTTSVNTNRDSGSSHTFVALLMVKFVVLGYIHSTTVINIIQPIYWQGIYHYYFFSCSAELEGDPLSSCTGKTKRSGRFSEGIWGQISGGVYRWPGTFHTSCHHCDNCIIVRFTILSPLSAPKGVKQWNNNFFINYWKHCKNHFTFKWTTSFNKWQQKKYAYNNGTF